MIVKGLNEWRVRDTNVTEGYYEGSTNEHEGSTNEHEGSLRRVGNEGGLGTSCFSYDFPFVFIRFLLFKFPFV